MDERTRDAIKASPSTTQAKNLAPTTLPKLAASTFPYTEREVMICFDSFLQSTIPTTTAAARYKVNSTMYTIDQKMISFIVAYISRNQNLVLITAPYHNSLESEVSLGVNNDVLPPLRRGLARINKKWTKYVTHNLSINTHLSTIKIELEKIYPALTLA
jgi:hypothetical protein